MNNREMLELAALAGGYEYDWRSGQILVDKVWRRWNPRDYSGDALELAVKLGLDVCTDLPQEEGARTHVCGFIATFGSDIVSIEEKYGDPYVATRLAITRAAAEIGRQMKERENEL